MTLDSIYQKHIAAASRIDGTWIDLNVFRYALRLALEEMAETAKPSGSVELIKQLSDLAMAKEDRINALQAWLDDDCNDPVEGHDAVDTAISTLKLFQDQLAYDKESMRLYAVELSSVTAERDAADKRCAELEQRIAQLDADNARLIEERNALERRCAELSVAARDLVTAAHTNGDGKVKMTLNVPTAAAAVEPTPNDWHQRIAVWFADNVEVLDWYESIHAGRNAFRNLPKEARWHLIAFVVRSLRNPETGEWPTMAEFDRNRPEWMSTSQAAVITFGNGRWQSILDRAKEA